MINTIFYFIVAILVLDYLLERYLEYLNTTTRTKHIPEKLEGIYDKDKYEQSQEYDKVNQKFAFVTSTFTLIIILIVLIFNGFGSLDKVVHELTTPAVYRTLIFFGILAIVADLISIPFSLYRTFVIESKFGFNKTTLKTFIFDRFKAWGLGILIGAPLLALITWIYTIAGHYFWVLTWIIVTLFSLFMTMFYTSLIVPIFNKLSPLEPGDLKDAIQDFAAKTGFTLAGIQVMDGSKRSQKANAYFSGLGSQKRIILFDTLIREHGKDELIAILAHEIGHYKKKHTRNGIIISILETGIMLFLLGIFISKPGLSMALGAKEGSFYMGVLAFGILYSPVSLVLGLFTNWFSRKNEYEADRFAGEQYNPESLKTALKNLSVNHLSNLTPHPAYVFFYYSHPTLLQRLNALDEVKKICVNHSG